VGNGVALKGKNIITGAELDAICDAELATQQRKRQRSNTEPAVSNITRASSSNAVETTDSAPLPHFVEGGVRN